MAFMDSCAASRFLFTWAAVVFLFFSISGAKLPHYLLPAIPPLAILIAGLFARREQGKKALLIPRGALATSLIVCVLINGGMVAWDRGLFKGAPQADARRLAGEARLLLAKDQSAGVAIYRMGRQSKSMGTGKLKVQETNLPSLLFYLDRDVLETDDFSAVLRSRRPLYILTRADRIGAEDRSAAGDRLQKVDETDFYVLWRLALPPFQRGRGL